MPLFLADEWTFALKAADLLTTNPFDPAWMQKQRDLLGSEAKDAGEVYAWKAGLGLWGPRTVYPDVVSLGDRIAMVVEAVHQRLPSGETGSARELEVYEALAMYLLYRNSGERFDLIIESAVKKQDVGPAIKEAWGEFGRDHKSLLCLPGANLPWAARPEHAFACFFALRRAFYHIFFTIIGRSRPVVRLRSAIWQSVVTHDVRDWGASHYERMRDFPTLITGPSGTGKELVAQAVGQSQYIPFHAKKRAFAINFLEAFQPVNLSALPPLLIESELFGSVKGAFSGAVRDRIGRLEECSKHGAVFLDEVGELTSELQVKLLRVLQARSFQRVGENQDRWFEGKIIAASNRDLGAEMQAGRFREDFYYRLCADRIQTPSLREQLADRPEDLHVMVEFICRRVVGEGVAERLTVEVVGWIESHLGPDYDWPGNFRELEQCVRSYTLRKDYQPMPRPAARTADGVADACQVLAESILRRDTTYDEIERRLFTQVRERTTSLQEAARMLGIDWRTLRARVNAGQERHGKMK
jgi:transcriptional regulator with AAA-type ATPase domain